MPCGVRSVVGPEHTTLLVIGIDDSKLRRLTLVSDDLLVCTVDDKVKMGVSFVMTMFMVEWSMTMTCI